MSDNVSVDRTVGVETEIKVKVMSRTIMRHGGSTDSGTRVRICVLVRVGSLDGRNGYMRTDVQDMCEMIARSGSKHSLETKKAPQETGDARAKETMSKLSPVMSSMFIVFQAPV